MAPPKRDPLERFFDKYVPEPNTGCWLWIASLSQDGYSQFRDENGRNTSGHRWAYTHWISEIPLGLELDHVCRITMCVNPHHLSLVTKVENNKRRWDADGRTSINRRRVLARQDFRPNAQKTQCPQGHTYDFENTIWWKTQRMCRACKRVYSRAYKLRKALRHRNG